jgi:outer membrane protein OmpA-like peptidoglycan-associated protein
MNKRTSSSVFFGLCFFVLVSFNAFCQNATVKGYVFEDQNRGFLNMAHIVITDTITNTVFLEVYSNIEGYFSGNVPAGIPLKTVISKEMFASQTQVLTLESGKTENLSVKMIRAPGYVFEVTLAEKRQYHDAPTKAINNARVEVYNNTTRTSISDIISESHEFKLNFIKGNHYTLLIRKSGYLTKRLEAYVNVNGCILCFEGVGDVRPGVVDNLSSNNTIGVLLANIELEKTTKGKTQVLSNIQYELGSAQLKTESYKELDNLASIALNNPALKFEIGSHTDSRGTTELNESLSNNRSATVVYYLVQKKNVPKNQLVSVGYGEKLLLNHCKDGVICSELDHQLNRRTELKIIAIDSQYVEQPLKQIKAMEEFEADLFRDNSATSKSAEPESTTNVKKADDKNNKSDNNHVDTKAVIKVTKADVKEPQAPSSKKVTDSGKYVIYAGRFTDKSNATKVIDKLYLLGYDSAVIKMIEGKHVVIVDFSATAEIADEIVKHLRLNKVETLIEPSN